MNEVEVMLLVVHAAAETIKKKLLNRSFSLRVHTAFSQTASRWRPLTTNTYTVSLEALSVSHHLKLRPPGDPRLGLVKVVGQHHRLHHPRGGGAEPGLAAPGGLGTAAECSTSPPCGMRTGEKHWERQREVKAAFQRRPEVLLREPLAG